MRVEREGKKRECRGGGGEMGWRERGGGERGMRQK